MKNFVGTLLILLSLSACTFYEPEFKGGEKIKDVNIEGRDVHFTAGAIVLNENGYAIKVKPSTLDVYVEGEYMGKVRLEQKVKMKAKKETYVESPFTATLAEGALFKAMKFANKDKIQIRLSGKVKAGVWFVSKKIDVNETRSIDGINFQNLGI